MAQAKTQWRWRRGPDPSAPRDYVHFILPSPYTHADIIRKGAQTHNLRIDGNLPETLEHFTYDDPRPIEGSLAAIFDWITQRHWRDNVQWAYSKDSDGTVAVRFEIVIDERVSLSPFDELTGRLMSEAPREANGWIPRDGYSRIAAELDGRGFKPREHVPGLARWNTRHPRIALLTFSATLGHRRGFRRVLLRRLKRAEAKYRKAHGG
jgi:hypothetical protein